MNHTIFTCYQYILYAISCLCNIVISWRPSFGENDENNARLFLKLSHSISHIFLVHMRNRVHININCDVQNFAQMTSCSLSKAF